MYYLLITLSFLTITQAAVYKEPLKPLLDAEIAFVNRNNPSRTFKFDLSEDGFELVNLTSHGGSNWIIEDGAEVSLDTDAKTYSYSFTATKKDLHMTAAKLKLPSWEESKTNVDLHFDTASVIFKISKTIINMTTCEDSVEVTVGPAVVHVVNDGHKDISDYFNKIVIPAYEELFKVQTALIKEASLHRPCIFNYTPLTKPSRW